MHRQRRDLGHRRVSISYSTVAGLPRVILAPRPGTAARTTRRSERLLSADAAAEGRRKRASVEKPREAESGRRGLEEEVEGGKRSAVEADAAAREAMVGGGGRASCWCRCRWCAGEEERMGWIGGRGCETGAEGFAYLEKKGEDWIWGIRGGPRIRPCRGPNREALDGSRHHGRVS